MISNKVIGAATMAAIAMVMGGCSSISENRGYVVDYALTDAVQPGIDNKTSVNATMGRPSFTSQYGDPTWYYVSSTTGRRPFVRPRIQKHSVLAVKFDDAGNVTSAERSGLETVSYLRPDGDKTPTLGRNRSFLEDLFGNIGTVGAPGAGPGG